MSQLRTLKILASALAIAFVSKAVAQSQYYPEASLTQIYTQKQLEEKKAEELEQKALEKAALYEKKKREVEQQVAAHRFQIENLKMRQEKAQQELDLLAVDLQHVNGDLASYQSEHQQLEESSKATIAYLDGQRQEMANKAKALEAELKSLADDRKKAEKEIYGMAMDIEHYKVDIAKMDTKVQEAEMKRAATEADEMKVRTEWIEAKKQAADHMRQRDEALTSLAEAKKRYDDAAKELAAAHQEMAKAEKIRNDVSKKVQGDIAKYEQEITQANRQRINNEAERIRLESEVAKITEYGSRMKDNRDSTLEQQAVSEGLVLKSSLALESARTALNKSVNDQDQAEYKSEKEQHKARGLAAAAKASEMVEGGRVWVTKENCKAYSGPNTKKPAGFFDSGKKLLAKDRGSRWVEIISMGGNSVFVESRCGSYSN